MEYYDCFAASYANARAKFLKAATAARGEVRSFLHPAKKAPDGGPLAIDVACFGDRKAARQALFLSGTHGQEGFSGSAVQIGWLNAGGAARLRDAGLIRYARGRISILDRQGLEARSCECYAVVRDAHMA